MTLFYHRSQGRTQVIDAENMFTYRNVRHSDRDFLTCSSDSKHLWKAGSPNYRTGARIQPALHDAQQSQMPEQRELSAVAFVHCWSGEQPWLLVLIGSCGRSLAAPTSMLYSAMLC